MANLKEWLGEGEEVEEQYGERYITNTRVVKAKESFTSFDYIAIEREHVTSVTAHKRPMWGLVAEGLFLFVFFSVFLVSLSSLPLIGSSSGLTTEVLLVLVVTGLGLIVVGLLLGPKRISFRTDGGEKLDHKLSSPSEMKEILRMFGKQYHG